MLRRVCRACRVLNKGSIVLPLLSTVSMYLDLKGLGTYGKIF